ncbi:SDR family NAD(P)-dependent oxidoreductase [Cellulomonas aerilata]|uniref:SDR family NAD(P)-dependent oxidoreductase n=1 Tax=Cellulomonas aerilata TaxID=515326 RepID=UPI0016499171|nr:SDR family oxidoreductase [Cellulomonas aerilata]
MTDADQGRALVVGASSAIGRAIAARLADRFALHLWGRDRTRLDETATACRRADRPSPVVEVVDVTDPAALAGAAGRVRDAGGLQVVVWAAGAFDWAPAPDADPATWRRVLDVNLVALAEAAALLVPELVAHAPGSLVLLGSGAAHRAYAGNAAYVASKHGVAGLAEALWLDLRRHHVGVTLVSPGLVAAGAGLGAPVAQDSPELLLQPEDVADAVGYAVDLATRGPARACPTVIRLDPYVEP